MKIRSAILELFRIYRQTDGSSELNRRSAGLRTHPESVTKSGIAVITRTLDKLVSDASTAQPTADVVSVGA
jgi:hypothetical protein